MVGNEARETLTVCLKIEDMRTTIKNMEAMYSWQIWIIKTVAYTIFAMFVLFCIWEFGHYFASCLRVLFSSKPSWEDFNIAYSLWFRMTSPFSSQHQIRSSVHKRYVDLYEDDYDEQNDEEDEEEEEEED